MAKVKVNQPNQPEHPSPLANGKLRTADSMVSNCLRIYSAHRFYGVDGTTAARLAHHPD